MSDSPGPIKADFYFTEEELKRSSPSVKLGNLTFKDEQRQLLSGGTFIRILANRLGEVYPEFQKITNLAVNVALIQFRRFYTIQSLTRFDPRDVGAAVLFLSSKGEECPRPLEYFVRAWFKIRQEFDNNIEDNVRINRDALEKFSEYIVWIENIVLQTIGFNLTLELPHPIVLNLAQSQKLDRKVTEALFHLTTDIIHITNWTVRFPNATIACACYYLFIVWRNEKSDSETQNGTSWLNKIENAPSIDQLQDMLKEFIVEWRNLDKKFHLAYLMDSVVRGPLREVLNSNLLVEDDRVLVEEKLHTGFAYRSAKSIILFFALFGAFIYSLQILAESNGYLNLCFVLKLLFNIYVILGLYGCTNLFVPFVVRISTWQFGRVDFRYHQFIAQLRQNESALYGIQQQIGSNDYIYAIGSRKRCIEELRDLIDRAREYACQIPSEIPLIDEFIENDLRLLAKLDEEILPEQLDFKAMKALWQFMYVQRSELLRNFAIYHHGECLRLLNENRWFSLFHFARASMIGLVKFSWSASRFDVHLENASTVKRHEHKVKQTTKINSQSERIRLITQLEFLLDNLYSSDSLSPEQTAEALINIASSIERRAAPKVNRVNVDSRIVEEEQESDYEVNPDVQNDEYQIYEAMVDDKSDTQTDDYMADYETDPLLECRGDLQAELKHVLVGRRQKDQELALNALAKRRNKAVEEVRQELEQESTTAKKEEPKIIRQSNTNPMINQNELLNALRNRFKNQETTVETFE
ncbi:Cyclin-T [Aphelenchoides bicaudatus]|nr:Cyclin-T [Aphelenchoides bicaudatus]